MVNAADTTTAVTSDTNPSVLGQDVTFTATVAANAPSTTTPSGFGAVRDRRRELRFAGRPRQLRPGLASTTAALAVGNHTVVARLPRHRQLQRLEGSLSPDQVVTTAATTTVDHVGTSRTRR